MASSAITADRFEQSLRVEFTRCPFGYCPFCSKALDWIPGALGGRIGRCPTRDCATQVHVFSSRMVSRPTAEGGNRG